MTPDPLQQWPALSRRTVLRAAGLAAAGTFTGWGVQGCASPLADTRITLGTGFSQGVYFALGNALADAWQAQLGLDQRPTVRATAGSVENLSLLAAGQVDVIFATADVADRAQADATSPELTPRALARVYDDVLQVVVAAESPINALSDLRNHRVSIGAGDSQVIVTARRLLTAAGLEPDRDLTAVQLGLDDSVAALRDGRLDAFFWSGGRPTEGVTALSRTRPIRLLDLYPVAPAVRREYPVYDVGTVPAGTYEGMRSPITTLLVRNFLLVPARMTDDVAEALVAAIFAERDRLIRANSAARAIDERAAIGTQPVPLHPGAQRYYQATKAFG